MIDLNVRNIKTATNNVLYNYNLDSNGSYFFESYF